MFITKKSIKTLTLISSLFILIGCNSNVTPEAEIPVITSISSDSTTTVNNSVTLNIEAMVTDEGQLTFQWYSATQEKLKEGIPIENETTGANTKDFTPDVSTAGTFYYYCVITNTLATSSSSIISPRISVTVNEKQSIGKQEIITMPKNFSGEIGDSFNFEVITSSKEGVTKQFQWYFSETENGDFTAIKDAIKNEYSGKIETNNLGFYYCVITYSITYDDETQTESLTTNIVQLADNVINANYPTIIIQPDDAAAVMTQTKTFKVKALSPDSETYDGTLSYQWYTISDDGTESFIIEDATTDTLNVTASRLLVGKTTEYYCVITNTITDNGDGGEKSKSVSSDTAKLTVEIVNAKTPIIDSNPVDIKAIIPAEGTFTVGATVSDGGTLTYQWYKAGTADDDGTLIEGATNKTFTVSTKEKQSTNYYCMITNTITNNGDGGIKSSVIKSNPVKFETVYLNDVISSYTIKKEPVELSFATPTATLNFEISLPGYIIKYQWFECSSETSTQGTAIIPTIENGANTTSFCPVYTEPGIHYYYCLAKLLISNGNNTNNTLELDLARSDLVCVVYTGLPTIYLNTGNTPTSEITKETYCLGSLKIVDAQYDTLQYSFTKKDKTTGKAKEGVKGRGNSSWNMPKKGYNIKFDSKESILGMPKSKKWCLIANYNDKSLLRNKYSSILSNNLFNSGWNPHFVFVDLVMNDEYLGNYIICEKNTIEDDRINIQDISDCTAKKINDGKYIDKNGDGEINLFDGGFILEVDQPSRVTDEDYYFRTSKCGFCLKDPDDVDDDIKVHIKTVVETAENVLYGDNFTDSENGWTKYMDINSFVDWYIINEFAKNNDARFYSSVYLFYNPADGKIHIGPIWDFDISCGNINYNGNDTPEGFWIKSSVWISRMFEDPQFVSKVKARWNEKKNELQETFAANGTIQTLADSIAVSAEFNFKKWPILGTNIWPNPAGYANRTTYQSEVDYLKTWLSTRYNWLDTAINGL